eukprot:1423311-Rhodomonas_salina.1
MAFQSDDADADVQLPRAEARRQVVPMVTPTDTDEFCHRSASRWLEAYEAGCAPPVCLDGTHQSVLKYGITLQMLQEHALPGEN